MMNRKMHIILTVIVLLSACSWLPYAVISSEMNIWLRVAMGIIGTLSFVLLFERDMYLPFLADCAFPVSLLSASPTPDTLNGKADTSVVSVGISKLPPRAKVVYWAAETKDPRSIGAKYWKEAYGEYSNSGVALANQSGVATISIRCPQAYTVSHLGIMNNEIPPHIHYRYELPGTKGMLSEVYTLAVQCKNPALL